MFQGGVELGVDYQTEPVYRIMLNEIEDIAVRHELGDHEALSGVAINIDCDEPEDVGMRDVLPKDSLLAEMLRQTRQYRERKNRVRCA